MILKLQVQYISRPIVLVIQARDYYNKTDLLAKMKYFVGKHNVVD